MNIRHFLCLSSLLLTIAGSLQAAEGLGNFVAVKPEGRSVVFSADNGTRIRITAYGESILRVQAAARGEEFFPDTAYAMVESHAWPGEILLKERGDGFSANLGPGGRLRVEVSKRPLRLAFFAADGSAPLLAETQGTVWEGPRIKTAFAPDPGEHFSGLGHDFFGRAASLDLRGQVVERNYGRGPGNQAPLMVPFFLSSKGYGLFLNSTFPNRFNFGREGAFEIGLTRDGFAAQMDYFFLLGPSIPELLDSYTRLTGRPRMPLLSFFGLALSDKASEKSPDRSNELWWKKKVSAMREAGIPLDHLINDNQWRAGGGERLVSILDWDLEKYPDPAEWRRWTTQNGLIVTVDFNRGIAKRIPGWKSGFNMPGAKGFDAADSSPDFTLPEVRSWFYGLFWNLAAKQGAYPADAFWIDEFDEMGATPKNAVMGNGRSWMEMRNNWFLLIAQALVAEGWEKTVGETRRPFVWIRGGTAGGQRYATLWTGDIQPTFEEMDRQIVGLQLSGLSGFPFAGHDQGGFFDFAAQKGPDETLYRHWSAAFGSFTPFWKPHGMGESRWPTDRSSQSLQAAKAYAELRFKLLPYTYSHAWEAYRTGLPLVRAMIVEHGDEEWAWKWDRQYFWGRDLLVVPLVFPDKAPVFRLPSGTWYDFWTDQRLAGGREASQPLNVLRMPLLVRAGALIPMASVAPSTAFLDRSGLEIHVYTGADGAFELYEDDGVSERFRTAGEKRLTLIRWNETDRQLTVEAAQGNYPGAPGIRAMKIVFHGLERTASVTVTGRKMAQGTGPGKLPAEGGYFYDAGTGRLEASIPAAPTGQSLVLRLE